MAAVDDKIDIAVHVITCARERCEHLQRLIENEARDFRLIRICEGQDYEFAKRFADQFDNVVVFYNEWRNDMSAQHNFLLGKAKIGEWILILDDDETTSPQLKNWLEKGEYKSGGFLKYRIASIMKIGDHYPKPIDFFIELVQRGEEQPFTKLILFKYTHGLRFQGDAHYTLNDESGLCPEPVPFPIIHHKKDVHEIIWCDLYQAVINPEMQGYNDEDAEWLRRHFGGMSPAELRKALEEGLDQEIERKFIEWKDCVLDNRCHWYWYYFFYLHPDRIADFSTDDISFQMYMRDLMGFRGFAVPGTTNVYPIYHLPMNPKLREMIGKDYVVLKYRKEDGKIVDEESGEVVMISDGIKEQNEIEVEQIIDPRYWEIFNRNMRNVIHRTQGPVSYTHLTLPTN